MLIGNYQKSADIESLAYDGRLEQSPGMMSRLEPATGLLVRGVSVNGKYLLTDSCDVYPRQDMKMEWFVQGGNLPGVANIGKKWVEGQIVCPVRVDRNGNIEPAVQAILENAHYPYKGLKLDTNHTLSFFGLTAENGGTDGNEMLSFDCLVVKDLSLKGAPGQGVKLTVSFIGTIEERKSSWLVAPPENYILGRALEWVDCNTSRYESEMRTVIASEVTIKNEIDMRVFLNPISTTASQRSDQVQVMGVKKSEWGGSFSEFLRLGAERHTYIHGGWMVNENLIMEFGPIIARIPVPLFQLGEQPFAAKVLKRSTKFWSQKRPNISNTKDLLFYFGSISADAPYPPIYTTSRDIESELQS